MRWNKKSKQPSMGQQDPTRISYQSFDQSLLTPASEAHPSLIKQILEGETHLRFEDTDNIDALDKTNRASALIYAAAHSDPDTAVALTKQLIEHGATVSRCDSNRMNAVMYAAASGNKALIALFFREPRSTLYINDTRSVARHALFRQDKHFRTALDLCITYGNTHEIGSFERVRYQECVNLLIASGAKLPGKRLSPDEGSFLASAKRSILIAAATNDTSHEKGVKEDTKKPKQPGLLERALSSGVSVNYRDPKTGTTPLIEAVKAGHVNMVDALLKAGAKVNLQDGIVQSKTKRNIFIRFVFSFANIFRFLIGRPAYKKYKYRIKGHSRTPLMWAAIKTSNPEIFHLLLDKGANRHKKDKDNRTAFDYALDKRPDTVAKHLFMHDAIKAFLGYSLVPAISASAMLGLAVLGFGFMPFTAPLMIAFASAGFLFPIFLRKVGYYPRSKLANGTFLLFAAGAITCGVLTFLGYIPVLMNYSNYLLLPAVLFSIIGGAAPFIVKAGFDFYSYLKMRFATPKEGEHLHINDIEHKVSPELSQTLIHDDPLMFGDFRSPSQRASESLLRQVASLTGGFIIEACLKMGADVLYQDDAGLLALEIALGQSNFVKNEDLSFDDKRSHAKGLAILVTETVSEIERRMNLLGTDKTLLREFAHRLQDPVKEFHAQLRQFYKGFPGNKTDSSTYLSTRAVELESILERYAAAPASPSSSLSSSS